MERTKKNLFHKDVLFCFNDKKQNLTAKVIPNIM